MTTVNNVKTTDTQTTQTTTAQPVKRGRGRPKGSRNKPKVAKPAVSSSVASEVSFEDLNN